jgi:NhaP-type Na+/H+ or K+/H+ antiporter
MAVVGGMGVGLVIGWIAGQIIARTLRRAVAAPAATGAAILAGLGVTLVSTTDAAAGYAPAALFATGLSIAWQRWLEARAVRSW